MSSRDSEQSLATQPEAPACRASAARRGSSFSASTTVRTRGWPERTPATSEMPSTERRPRCRPGRARRGHGRPAPLRRAQVGVDEQHVVTAPLGCRALQAAQRGGTAARRGHVDVGLGRQCRGERLGEDAVVVDDQDSDANHRNPLPQAPRRAGDTRHGVGRTDARCGHDARSTPVDRRRTAAAVRRPLPPLRASYPTVSPPDRHRPPPVLLIRVRPGGRSGR